MASPKRVVIVSGYYCPIHASHIEYFSNAKKLAGPDGLVYAIVNTDYQSILKKGYSFIPEKDRLAVVEAIKYIDKAFLSIDTDRTVCKTIEMIYNTEEHKPTMLFNEGDQKSNCAEEGICKTLGIEVIYGEAPKTQSSSWILEKSVKIAYEKMYGEK